MGPTFTTSVLADTEFELKPTAPAVKLLDFL
jgi:hypothetical protein